MKKRFSDSLLLVSKVGIVLLLCLSLAGYLGEQSLYLELTSHFKLQYLVLSLACVCFLGLLREREWLLVGVVTVVLNGSVVIPWYIDKPNPTASDAESHLRLLLSNVNTANTNYTGLVQLIEGEGPDIFILQEVNERWLDAIPTLVQKYPYQKLIPREDNCGMAVLIHIPFEEAAIHDFGSAFVPTIVTTFRFENRSITLIATHPLRLFSSSKRSTRRSYPLYTAARATPHFSGRSQCITLVAIL